MFVHDPTFHEVNSPLNSLSISSVSPSTFLINALVEMVLTIPEWLEIDIALVSWLVYSVLCEY